MLATYQILLSIITSSLKRNGFPEDDEKSMTFFKKYVVIKVNITKDSDIFKLEFSKLYFLIYDMKYIYINENIYILYKKCKIK